MLNNANNRLAPSSGILANSTRAPANLSVCRPLQNQEVCCEGPAWDELKDNYDQIKGRFKAFVQRRRARIEKIEKDLNEELVEEVSDILNDNEAMVKSDAFKMEYQKLIALGKKTKGGKDIRFNPVHRKKYDHRGFQVCRGDQKKREKCREKVLEAEKKAEEKYEKWIKKQQEEKEKWQEELERRRKEENSTDDSNSTDDKNSTDTNSTDDKNSTDNSTDGTRRFLDILRSISKDISNDASFTVGSEEDVKVDDSDIMSDDERKEREEEEERREEEEEERIEREEEWKKEQEDRLEEADKKRKEWEKEQREMQEKLEKWDKKMSKEQQEKWKKEKERAKKDFERQMKERKEREKDARDAKKKIAKAARKMRRVRFIKHQAKCFKRLFKVTVGMMCMTCNANYKQYFMKTNGTWQVVMNQGVCNNLMKDCYPYLNHTSIQGRSMLDMKRMKKFQKNKAEIQKRLADIKRKIADSDDQDAVVEALSKYQDKLTDAMRLKSEDFEGEGAEDFKYHFKMPLKCLNDTHCDWICQNMIKADGISDDSVNSTQNTDIEDLEADEDQQFETDLVVVDDSEDDDVADDEEKSNSTDDRPPVNARLLAESTIGLVYDAEGYNADDDTFEYGVIVADPAMAEGLVIPEDQIDDYPISQDEGIPLWFIILAVTCATLVTAGAIFTCTYKGDKKYTHNNGGPQGIDMQEMNMRETTMTQVI